MDDLALLTSDNEGMPVTLVEAALAGLPAVTTGVGSAGEVVVDGVTGSVVPCDVDALVEAVRELLAERAATASRCGRPAARASDLLRCGDGRGAPAALRGPG